MDEQSWGNQFRPSFVWQAKAFVWQTKTNVSANLVFSSNWFRVLVVNGVQVCLRHQARLHPQEVL
jgi:hypothetical protein